MIGYSKRQFLVVLLALAAIVGSGCAARGGGASDSGNGGEPPGGGAGSGTSSARVRVAAASDLKPALDEIVRAFNSTNTGTELNVVTTYGSSGNFYAQITNGAPFDLFLSADSTYPDRLVADGRGTVTDTFRYATGRLAIYSTRISGEELERRGLASLSDPAVRKIAIANPDHAPYGRAAVEAMTSVDLYEPLKSRLVFGENVAQTAEFALSGAADAGIIALSLAMTPQLTDRGHHVEVAATLHGSLAQSGLVIKSAKNSEGARRFAEFITSDEGQRILAEKGFGPPWTPADQLPPPSNPSRAR